MTKVADGRRSLHGRGHDCPGLAHVAFDLRGRAAIAVVSLVLCYAGYARSQASSSGEAVPADESLGDGIVESPIAPEEGPDDDTPSAADASAPEGENMPAAGIATSDGSEASEVSESSEAGGDSGSNDLGLLLGRVTFWWSDGRRGGAAVSAALAPDAIPRGTVLLAAAPGGVRQSREVVVDLSPWSHWLRRDGGDFEPITNARPVITTDDVTVLLMDDFALRDTYTIEVALECPSPEQPVFMDKSGLKMAMGEIPAHDGSTVSFPFSSVTGTGVEDEGDWWPPGGVDLMGLPVIDAAGRLVALALLGRVEETGTPTSIRGALVCGASGEELRDFRRTKAESFGLWSLSFGISVTGLGARFSSAPSPSLAGVEGAWAPAFVGSLDFSVVNWSDRTEAEDLVFETLFGGLSVVFGHVWSPIDRTLFGIVLGMPYLQGVSLRFPSLGLSVGFPGIQFGFLSASGDALDEESENWWSTIRFRLPIGYSNDWLHVLVSPEVWLFLQGASGILVGGTVVFDLMKGY